jgi:hypothetical protein
LLIQLRQPQLSRQLDEERLSAALSEALPPPAPTMLADVADAYRALEADGEALEVISLPRGMRRRRVDLGSRAGWLGLGLVGLALIGGCGKGGATNDGGGGGGGAAGGNAGAGAGAGAAGRDAGSGGGGTAGGGSGGGSAGAAGSGGANVDGSSQDRSSDARSTPKLTWTLILQGWDADFVAGAADGEVWTASKPSSVMQMRTDGTMSATSLNLLGSAYVTGLWVAGPGNVYASAYANLVLHWDGSGTWKRDIMTSGTTFSSVWGSSPTDIYASGGGGPYYSTGDDKWVARPVLETTIAGTGPLGGTGPNDIWIAGVYGEIFRSNGDGTWHKEATPATPGVNQLWVATPDEAYMVSNSTIMHRLPSTGSWVAEPTPLASTDYLHCLWGSGPDDVYAGSNQAHLFHSTGDGVWQDEGFSPGTSFPPAIKGIWGRSASDVYLATSNGVYHGAP